MRSNVDALEECIGDLEFTDADSSTTKELEHTENVEFTEIVNDSTLECGVRNDHSKDNAHKHVLATLELELCKTVSDTCTGECLEHRGGSCEDHSVKESSCVIQLKEYEFIHIQCPVFRNKDNRGVDKILRCHKGRHDLRNEREKNDVSNTYEKYESEDVPDHFREEECREELRFKSLLKGSSFEFNSYLIFAFSFYLRLIVHCVIHLFPSLISSLIEYECRNQS